MRRLFFLLIVLSAVVSNAITYTVTVAADSGPGSLRDAINQANSSIGVPDIITFSISPAGSYTITLTTTALSLTDNAGVTIDGYSQPGSSVNTNSVVSGLNGVVAITLFNGANILTGLNVTSTNNIIKGLSIPNFGDAVGSSNDIGINISANNNQVLGCYIGVAADGVTAYARTYYGIYINNCSGNIIGDGTTGGRNLILGIFTDPGAPVGSTGVGSAGIYLTGSGASNNIIKTNIIGMKSDGLAAFTYTATAAGSGIFLDQAGSGNTIGGTFTTEGNLISGNANHGIQINNGTGGNTIKGNIVGLKINGTGIPLVIPGSPPVYFQFSGIVVGQSPGNIIGGNSNIEKNVCSGNDFMGIWITGASQGTVVKGNYVGPNVTGTAIVAGANQTEGIYINNASSITVGGTGTGEGNVCTGNAEGCCTFTDFANGIMVDGGGSGVKIIGNICGLQANGISRMVGSNQAQGINITNATSVVVGGTLPAERNIASGNSRGGASGIVILGGASTDNFIIGNYVGVGAIPTTHITGTSQIVGISVGISAFRNVIGGLSADSANIISGNNDGSGAGTGVSLQSNNNRVAGNTIGLQGNKKTYLTNNVQGIGIVNDGASNTIIKNTISGNDGGAFHSGVECGIRVDGGSCAIKGNSIGLDSAGNTIVAGALQNFGIYMPSTTATVTIGGTAPSEKNIISGNDDGSGGGVGIKIEEADGNLVIMNNVIGLQSDGQSIVAGNQQAYGVYALAATSVPSFTVGGTTTSRRNIISGNTSAGILLDGAAAAGISIYGNYIGSTYSITPVSGSSQDYGVQLTNGAHDNFIGGWYSGRANTIAFNTVDGVNISNGSGTSNHNLISRNPIYGNSILPLSNLAIDLTGSGNDLYALPTITSAGATVISGTGTNGDSVEVFTSNNCINALSFVGSAKVSPGGAWTLSLSSPIAAGDKVFANARNIANNNTSQFSQCICSVASIDVTANSTICRGDSLYLSVFTVGASTSYSWSPGTGLSSSTGSIIKSSPQGVTTYTVMEAVCGNTGMVTISANALPTVAATSSASICLGFNITLTATGAASYAWTPSVLNLNTNAGPSVIASPSVASIYSYTVIGADGTALNCKNKIVTTVLVNPLPAAGAGPDQSICPGLSTALTASGGVSYRWFPESYLNSTVGAGPTCTPPALGNYGYTVTVTDANGCVASDNVVIAQVAAITANAGADLSICTGVCTTLTGSGGSTYVWRSAGISATSNIFVSACPTASASYSLTAFGGSFNCFATDVVQINLLAIPVLSASTDATVCLGNSTTLTVTGAATYMWSPNTELNSTTGSGVSASPTSFIVYTVSGTDGYGCATSTNVNVSVSINPLPLISVSPSVTAICPGSSQSLAASGSSAAQPINYTWSSGVSPSTGVNVAATPLSTTSYTVTGTDNNGCYNTAVANITVNPAPVVVITSPTGPIGICYGSSVLITVGGASTYLWIAPDTSLSSSSGTTVTADPISSTSYTVAGTDINGCIASKTFTVVVGASLLITVSPDFTVCPGTPALLTASGAGVTSYQWTSGTIPSSGSSVYGYPNTPTTYTVTGTDANGCKGTDTVKVGVFSTSPVSLGADTIINRGDSASLTASGGGTISWAPTNGLSCNACLTPMASPDETTSYTVTMTDTNGCISTDVITVTVNINCKDPYVPDAFSPNDDGENDLLKVYFETFCAKDFSFKVFDRWGIKAFETTDISLSSWDGKYPDGKKATSGVFFYRVVNTSADLTTKVHSGNITLLR